jgi:hypothetical protein
MRNLDEFDARVKEAYRVTAYAEDSRVYYSSAAEYSLAVATSVLRQALVHERTMRQMMEWQRSHSCARTTDWGNNPWYTHCADPRHDWTDEQWRASVEEELSR